MCADHHHPSSWLRRNFLDESTYSFDVDNIIEKMAVQDLVSKRLNRQYLLASDIYCRSTTYKPIRSLSISTLYRSLNTYRSHGTRSLLPRAISPVELPHVTGTHYRPPYICKQDHRYDLSYLNSYNREPSLFPLAQDSHRLQVDYEKFYAKKQHAVRRSNSRRRWRIYGCLLIFYFMLKRNLRLAKQQETFHQRAYRRIRFFELSTVVHRVYLDPNSSIYQTLAYVITTSTKLLSQDSLFHCVQTIIDQITNLLPHEGIIGTHSEESVLIYLLNCSLEQYPPTYFWSIERRLLSISYSKMRECGLTQLDHFTTKYLILSTFIFHGLIKTLLLKPVKYRLTRGQLHRFQWLNIRLLSTLILYVARHAVIYKEDKHHRPMPFPFEMKTYLVDDERLKKNYKILDELVKSTAPKLSAWSSDYAGRLQRYMRTRL